MDAFKETEIGLIPESWKVINISEVGQVITGKTPSTKEKKFYGGEFRLLSPADLDNVGI